MLKCKA